MMPVQNQASTDYFYIGEGSKVHNTAIVGMQPMRSPTFARPLASGLALPLIGAGVTIGPYAILYVGCEIADGTQVCPYAHVREGVKIGRNCVIGVGVQLGFDVYVGNDVQIMDYTNLSGGTVIGDRCFIGMQVVMANDDQPRGYKWKGVTPVVIGSDVVIGSGALLRPGVHVGNDATIGMGAVVTHDVEYASMVKGFPARTAA